jgi:RNA polymerase sigma factor (sigma-70 family)
MTHSTRPPSVLGCLRAALGPDARGPADAELLGRFIQNLDEGAFELLIWRHAGMVLRVCQTAVRDYHTAEDACQAVFLALARQAGAVGRSGTVAGWLYRVARRVARRMAESRRRLPDGQAVDLDQLPGPNPDVDLDRFKVLYEELDRLSEKCRDPLVLCYLQGLTVAETAKRLGWPIGTVGGRVARAKAILHRRLSTRGMGVPATGLTTLMAAGLVGAVPPSFAENTARSAVAFVTGVGAASVVSGIVLELAKGATETMTATKTVSAIGVLAACGTLLLGGVWAAEQWAGEEPLPPGSKVERSVATAPVGQTGQAGRTATLADRRRSLENLKQFELALLEFESLNGSLPTDIRDKNGKPLLSWRVAVLPHLGQDDLHKQFRLDETWDSEHNKKLLARMPDMYRVGFQPKDAIDTYYQVFAGTGTPFDPKSVERVPDGKFPYLFRSTVKIPGDIPNGTANTLGVVEAGRPVPWAKPIDLSYDPKKPLPMLDGPFSDILHVGTVDGRVHALRRDLNKEVLRIMIESADRGVTPDFEAYAVPLPREPAGVKEGPTNSQDNDTVRRAAAADAEAAAAGTKSAPAAVDLTKIDRTKPTPVAVDLTKIDRTITKEPKYVSKPYYALLAFGPAAEKRVWLVLDGDVLYLDRNGNGDLTEEGERILAFAKDKINPAGQACSHFQKFTLKALGGAVGKDGAEEFQLDHWIKDPAFVPKTDFDKAIAKDRAAWESATLWRIVGKERIQIPITFVPRASDVQISHIGGPLAVVLRFPYDQAFRRGSRPDILEVMIGTPGLSVKNDRLRALAPLMTSEVPADVHPRAEIEFPGRLPADKPIRVTVVLSQRCCGDNFYAPVSVPTEAGAGVAKVMVSFPNATPCTAEIPLVDGKRDSGDRPKKSDK